MKRPGLWVSRLGIMLLVAWFLLHAGYLVWCWIDVQLPSEERRLRSWEHPVGILSNLLFGASGMFLALAIFWRSGKQIDLLQESVFHTLIDPESVVPQVAAIVADANKRKDSRLNVMVYWLWFGADEAISRNSEALTKPELIKGECSDLWKLLKHRAIDGYETTVVVYDANANGEKVEGFIRAALGWWNKRVGSHEQLNLANAAQDIRKRYGVALEQFADEILSRQSTGFQPLSFRDTIPMIMFAAIDSTGWAHGLTYMAEVDALESGSRLGAFYSRDPKIVQVMLDQIQSLAKPPK